MSAVPLPRPHLDKLNALLANSKLPEPDRPRVELAHQRYSQWIAGTQAALSAATAPAAVLEKAVRLLDEYVFFIDVDLVFDSAGDFLYRQKGQTKLDNSIIEEFLPHLMHPLLVPEIDGRELVIGPTTCYSAVYFESSLITPSIGGGLRIRTKAQDFAICRRLYLKASYSADFEQAAVQDTNLAYVVAECKTNLDKTMFQEACATAHDVKMAVPGSRYYLLCEWLDMAPVSTAPTDVDEVLLLRKARRLGAGVRQTFSTAAGRRSLRDVYAKHLRDHPLRPEVFLRFLEHIRALLRSEGPEEPGVLEAGYF